MLAGRLQEVVCLSFVLLVKLLFSESKWFLVTFFFDKIYQTLQLMLEFWIVKL